MSKKAEQELAKIEDSQGKLRESIEQTKLLAQQADKLLKAHRGPTRSSQTIERPLDGLGSLSL